MTLATPTLVTPIYELKKCAWSECTNFFYPNSPNHQYCSPECSQAANRESKREWHQRNKLTFLGTSNFSANANPDFNLELQAVTNHKATVLSNSKLSNRYIEDANNKHNVAITHRGATGQSYFEFSVYLATKMPRAGVCSECNHPTTLDKDFKHAEVVCTECGLVLSGPISPVKFSFPWIHGYPEHEEHED